MLSLHDRVNNYFERRDLTFEIDVLFAITISFNRDSLDVSFKPLDIIIIISSIHS